MAQLCRETTLQLPFTDTARSRKETGTKTLEWRQFRETKRETGRARIRSPGYTARTTRDVWVKAAKISASKGRPMMGPADSNTPGLAFGAWPTQK